MDCGQDYAGGGKGEVRAPPTPGEDDFLEVVHTRAAMVVEEAHQPSSDGESSDASGKHGKRDSATRGRVCEACEGHAKAAPSGGLLSKVRRCHACDRKRDAVEKKPAQQSGDLRGEDAAEQERDEADADIKESHAAAAANEFLSEVKMACGSGERHTEVLRSFCTESYAMVHEQHLELPAPLATKPSTPATSEDERLVSKRREGGIRASKRESKTPEPNSAERKERNGYSRGRLFLEREIAAFNERRDEVVEVDLQQRAREEPEMEKRERGWVINGSKGTILKMAAMRNASAPPLDAATATPGKERKERGKVKVLKEKADTKRILGLVARRSESRVTSPKLRSSDTNERDGEFARLDAIKTTGDVHEKERKSGATAEAAYLKATSGSDGNAVSVHGEGEAAKGLQPNPELAVSRSHSRVLSRQNSGSKISSPTSTSCRINDNPLYGTNSEMELLSGGLTEVTHANLYSSLPSPASSIAYGKSPEPPGTASQHGRRERRARCASTFATPEPSPVYGSALASPACQSPEPAERTVALHPHRTKPEKVELIVLMETSSPPTGCSAPSKGIANLGEIEVVDSTPAGRSSDGTVAQSCASFGEAAIMTDPRRSATGLRSPSVAGSRKRAPEKKEVSFKKEPEVISYKARRSWGRILMWPAQMLLRALAFQFKLALQALYLVLWLLNSVLCGLGLPFLVLKGVVSVAAGKVGSWLMDGCVSGGSGGAATAAGQSSSGCRNVANTYVMLALTSLFLPSLFDLDFYLVNRFVEGQVVIREALYFDYTKVHPVAVVHLLPQHIMGKAKGFAFNLPDKEVQAARAIPASHRFHVTVHLTVPESEYNHQIGMFQVVAETFTVRGHSLEKASRASILRFHSPPVRIAKSVLTGIPVLMRLCQESQTLAIRVMDSQEEQELTPTATIRVLLEPKAGYSTGSGVPEIYKAELQVVSHFPWMREVARSWLWTLYVYSGLGLFVFEALLVMCCCRRVFPRKLGSGGDSKAIEDSGSREFKGIPERGATRNPPLPGFKGAPSKRAHIVFQKGLPLASPSSSAKLDSSTGVVALRGDVTVEEIQIATVAHDQSRTTS